MRVLVSPLIILLLGQNPNHLLIGQFGTSVLKVNKTSLILLLLSPTIEPAIAFHVRSYFCYSQLPITRKQMSESKSTNEQNGISPQSNKCVTSEDPRFTQIISPFTALSLQFQPQYHLNGYDTLSLHVNIRKVHHSRLFCVKPSENLLLMLMKEQPELTSMLGSKFEVVLTSYDKINEEMAIIPLESVSDRVPTKYKAIPLTINIVENAIAIVKRLDDQTHNDNQSPDDPTMEGCVRRYLKILDDIIMKKTNKEGALRAFCRKVYAQSKDLLVVGDSDGDDDDSNSNNTEWEFDSMTVPQLRQFIIDTIARWTRIIIHVMDGIHRLTAYRLAMTNDIAASHGHLIEDVTAYANVDPNPHMKQEMSVYYSSFFD